MDELHEIVEEPMVFPVIADDQLDSDIEAKPPRYGVGDKITSFALSGSKTGTISKICDKVSGSGHPIYEIIDEFGEKHEICETLFDDEKELRAQEEMSTVASTNSSSSNTDFDIERIRQENEKAISQIIENLGLEVSEDPIVQLKNCCKLQAYMAENNGYNSNVMDEKNDYSVESIVDIDLYNALVKKNGVCTSNSLMFQSILSKLGIPVECVGLTVNSEAGGFHMANMVSLHGDWYYFDTTLEGSIRKDNLDKELVLCCAGLGNQEYCPYYTPQCIVRPDGTYDLPGNISEERIPFPVVNSFFSPDEYGAKSM